jgi:hypothetical protein
MLQAIRSRIRDPMRSLKFFNLPNSSGRTRPGVNSASNRNEYQKQQNYVLGGEARPVPKADNLTKICELIV